MKDFLSLILVLISTITVQGNITVSVNGYSGFPIALEKMSNALIPLFDTLSVDTLSPSGDATLYFAENDAGIYYLSIGNRHLPVPLEQGAEYAIVLDPPQVEEALFGKFSIKHFEANGEKQSYLHDYINTFNKALSRFATENPTLKQDSGALHKLDSFGLAIEYQLKPAFNDYPYLQRYTNTRFSLFANALSQSNNYLNGAVDEPNDLTNPLSLEIFLATHESEINTLLFTKSDTLKTIAQNDSLVNGLKKVLSLKTINDFGVEVILFDLLYTKGLPGFTDEKRIAALKELGKTTSYTKIEQACKSGYQKLNMLFPNTKAPDFNFTDDKGRTVSLSSLKGRFIYLQFWNQKNTAGLLDMKLIDKIRKTYGKKIAFVSIHCYGSKEDFKQYMETHTYKWPIFHVEQNHPILTDYAIKTTPMYYLIDPEGYLFRSPAERPNRMYLTFDKINASEISGVKSYEIIRTYNEE
jgi:cytochrome oxidase Cu insertion factor (SCO1/SenC/PrrC family)